MSQFAEETAVTRVAGDHYRGRLCRGWRVGGVPNGGYVLAVAGRVLREALRHKDPLSVNAFYLAPTRLGPIDCHVAPLRSGPGTSFATVRMVQDGEPKVQVTAAYTDLGRLKGESWSAEPPPDLPPWDETGLAAQDVLEFHERVDVRLVGGHGVFSGKGPDGSGIFCGLARLKDGSEPDVLSLLMFADSLPPPVFNVFGPVGWVPTVELTVQVRAHPAPGPLQARFRSRHLTRGVVEEDGEIWDSEGRLVCLSRQTAKIRRRRETERDGEAMEA